MKTHIDRLDLRGNGGNGGSKIGTGTNGSSGVIYRFNTQSYS